ncbi:MAG TPA: hypothetical protein VK066_30870 [Chloroflexota bacterium]|nr:hypothetical protein [Chloroflexota bacterium]
MAPRLTVQIGGERYQLVPSATVDDADCYLIEYYGGAYVCHRILNL